MQVDILGISQCQVDSTCQGCPYRTRIAARISLKPEGCKQLYQLVATSYIPVGMLMPHPAALNLDEATVCCSVAASCGLTTSLALPLQSASSLLQA